ncbi:MAG: outer membrane lipoprotein carrier protein LolA [Longimicrobiales bacterium]|nr:outer membrane lipoprotein carrier protein LolA [Longimicrobiales bacterium]
MSNAARRSSLFLILALGQQGVGTLPTDLSAQGATALSLMEEAGARYREIRGFCASFEQTLAIPLLGETTFSKGSLCQETPNLFAMRFSDPEGDVLVADGESFWVYYPSSDAKQVLRFAMEVRPGGVDFHREFLEAPAEKYEMEYLGQETLAGRSTHLISLKPLEPSGFQEARIWLDSQRSLIIKARIGMENGSVRTVTLSGIQLNPPPDPERFNFVPPPGAQVIRRH